MAGNNTRVNILVEGQTEESFVRDLLVPHLAGFSVWATARVVRTSKYHKGGAVSYVKICDQVSRWCLEDQTAVVTTMFDVYGLPANYPGVNAWNNAGNAVNQVALLENTLKNSVAKQNFLPYLQLHEFEALLFSDLDAFAYCDVDPAHIVGWQAELAAVANPELLNNSPLTAPSKRLIARWPTYERSKPLYGTLVALQIGLPRMRAKCPRFNDWITKLEGL